MRNLRVQPTTLHTFVQSGLVWAIFIVAGVLGSLWLSQLGDLPRGINWIVTPFVNFLTHDSPTIVTLWLVLAWIFDTTLVAGCLTFFRRNKNNR